MRDFGVLYNQVVLTGASLFATLFSGQNSSVKTVDLGYATYQSDLSLAEGVTSFLGIRYAAPPTGDLRFRSPRVPDVIEEIQSAMTQPPQCWQDFIWGSNTTNPYVLAVKYSDTGPVDIPQIGGALLPESSSEDCLFLNVHIPSTLDLDHNLDNSSLPVLVWIHGGGYFAGNAHEYPMERLVRDSGNSLIAVNIQYRLGAFGFLSGKEVKSNGDLNVGILDQRLALKWVQTHIAKFGGDPKRVTIFGESAGGGSVLQHLIAYGGQDSSPPFRSAITNSPFLPPQLEWNDPAVEIVYKTLVSSVGCIDSGDALACLRSTDAEVIQKAASSVTIANFMGAFTFNPVVDGSLIVERPTVTLKKRKTNTNSVLVFTNSAEGPVFTDPQKLVANNLTIDTYISTLFPRLDRKQVEKAAQLYSSLGNSDIVYLAGEVMGESIYTCPAYFILDAHKGKPTWKGLFAIPPGWHGQDLHYIFDGSQFFGMSASYKNTDFAHSFRQAFFSSIVYGDPNSPSVAPVITPPWPQYDAGKVEMLFSKTDDDLPEVRVFQTDATLLERCAFWNSVSKFTGQ